MKATTSTQVSGDRRHGTVRVELPQDHEADVILVMPGGQEITLQYRLESPSIDICLPQPLLVTNWKDGDLTPAQTDKKHPNMLKVQQTCIDLPPDWVDKPQSKQKGAPIIGEMTDEEAKRVNGLLEQKEHLQYVCYLMLNALDRAGLSAAIKEAEKRGVMDEGATARFYPGKEHSEGGCSESEWYNIPDLLQEWRETTDKFCLMIAEAGRRDTKKPEAKPKKAKKATKKK